MSIRIRLVVKLIGENRIRRFSRNSPRHHHIAVRMIRWNCRRRNDDLGSECFEQPDFFLRHFVRHREDAFVTAKSRCDGKRDSGVTAGSFDNRSAGSERSVSLRLFDNRNCDSIFDRSTGIEKLSLRINRCANPTRYRIQSDQWRPANRIEDTLIGTLVAFRFCHHRFLLDDFFDADVFGFAESFTTAGGFRTVAAPVFRKIVSPGSGGASGCLKYTGNRIETGTGSPRVLAGMNLSSLDPFTAAESSEGMPEVSATFVDSLTT